MPRTKPHTEIKLASAGRDFFPLHVNSDAVVFICVTNNRIREIPALGNFYPRLTTLHIDNNQVAHLPTELGEVPLATLDLAHNEVATAAASWTDTPLATHLKTIVLAFNRLRTLPACLLHCTLLRNVDLRHNQLDSLPSLAALASLEELSLSFNNFGKWPVGVNELPHLRVVTLDNNRLSSCRVPDSLPALEELELSFNPEMHIFTLPRLVGLKRLNLVSTPVFNNYARTWWQTDPDIATAAILGHNGAEYGLDVPDQSLKTEALSLDSGIENQQAKRAKIV